MEDTRCGLKFPTSALKLGCVNNNWSVIFQEETDEDTPSEIKFGVSGMLVITGNTLIYFDEKPDSLAIEELY